MNSWTNSTAPAAAAPRPERAIQPTVLWAAAEPRCAGGPRLELWASCAGGCEPLAAAELAALGWRRLEVARPAGVGSGEAAGLLWERGSVYGEADLAALYRTLWSARTITRVVLLLTATGAATLADIAEVVGGLDLTILPFAPFAVRAERHGEHPFRSPDIATVAGQAVIDRYRAATGQRLPVDLDDPVTVVRVELSGSRLRVGLDLVPGSLHRRPYTANQHPAALKATVASALLLLAGWRREESLLDPVCGGGTILVEAGRAALRRPVGPPGTERLAALGIHDPALAETVAAAVRAAELPPEPLAIRGVELSPVHLERARRNLAAAGLGGVVEVGEGDARALKGVGEVDCVVANPPYGVRVGSPRMLRPLYTRALASIAERLAPGGRVVWLTPARRIAERAAHAAGLELAAAPRISLGAFDATACLFTPGPAPEDRPCGQPRRGCP